jgi:hypothetical protein
MKHDQNLLDSRKARELSNFLNQGTLQGENLTCNRKT